MDSYDNRQKKEEWRTVEQHLRRQGKSKEELVQLPLITDFDALWFAKELFVENRALSG
jgi:hypothetical protein